MVLPSIEETDGNRQDGSPIWDETGPVNFPQANLQESAFQAAPALARWNRPEGALSCLNDSKTGRMGQDERVCE